MLIKLQGETDIEQLAIVLHKLGTPTEEIWPGLTNLPDYNKITFGISEGIDVGSLLEINSKEGKNLIKTLVQYDHNKRLTAKKV